MFDSSSLSFFFLRHFADLPFTTNKSSFHQDNASQLPTHITRHIQQNTIVGSAHIRTLILCNSLHSVLSGQRFALPSIVATVIHRRTSYRKPSPSTTTPSTKPYSTSSDTSALYVSHTPRQRPQTPAASRAATISHTAETL